VVADRPAPELGTRHAAHLAEDVPQGQVDAGDGRGPDDAVPVPEVLPVHHLPEVLDPRRVFAHQQLGTVLHGPDDGPRVPLERGLAPAEQAVLIGEYLHEHPVPHPGVTDVGLDANDLHADSGAGTVRGHLGKHPC